MAARPARRARRTPRRRRLRRDRDALERLLGALQAGDLAVAREIAVAGREAEGDPRAPLRHLLAFLDRLAAGDEGLAGYGEAAARLRERVVLTGRLEHDELAPVVLAACESCGRAQHVPEAFGMVAAEAAACGALPLSAAHSGLAEVTALLQAAVPAAARDWLAFAVDDGAVEAIASRLVAWLRAPAALRAETRQALTSVARERHSGGRRPPRSRPRRRAGWRSWRPSRDPFERGAPVRPSGQSSRADEVGPLQQGRARRRRRRARRLRRPHRERLLGDPGRRRRRRRRGQAAVRRALRLRATSWAARRPRASPGPTSTRPSSSL